MLSYLIQSIEKIFYIDILPLLRKQLRTPQLYQNIKLLLFRESSPTLPTGSTRCIMDQILPTREACLEELSNTPAMSWISRGSCRETLTKQFLIFLSLLEGMESSLSNHSPSPTENGLFGGQQPKLYQFFSQEGFPKPGVVKNTNLVITLVF